jgi:hypothetical protein
MKTSLDFLTRVRANAPTQRHCTQLIPGEQGWLQWRKNWNGQEVAGVGGENRYILEGETAQRGAASQAVGNASPGDGIKLVPAV